MGRLRKVSWLLVLVVGGVLFELVRRTLVDTQNPNFVPTLLLLGAATVPVAFVAFIRSRLRSLPKSASAPSQAPLRERRLPTAAW